MQPAALDAMLDAPRSEPEPQQIAPGQNPVLRSRQQPRRRATR